MRDDLLFPKPPRRGECFPWLTLPFVTSFEEIVQFDRSAYARGNTRYLRVLHELEILAMPEPAQEEVRAKQLNAVLVTHFGPDVRIRQYLQAAHTLFS